MKVNLNDDMAMMATARDVAEAMQVLAEQRAGNRILSTEDIANLVRWALLVERAAEAGERACAALADVSTIGGLARLKGEAVASRVLEQTARAIQEYPNLFAEYPLLTELRELVRNAQP